MAGKPTKTGKELAKTNKKAPATKKVELVAKATKSGKNILLFTGGILVGALAVKGINKILKVDTTTVGIKKGIAPVAVTLAGIAGAMFIPKDEFQVLSQGVATAGILKGVQTFAGKDLLNGLMGLDAGEEMKFEIKEFRPNLPELEGLDDDEKIEGLEKSAKKGNVQLLKEQINHQELQKLESVEIIEPDGILGDTFI